MAIPIYPRRLENANQFTCAKIPNTDPYRFMPLLRLLALLFLDGRVNVK